MPVIAGSFATQAVGAQARVFKLGVACVCFVSGLFEFLAPLKRPRPVDMHSTDLGAAHGELLNRALVIGLLYCSAFCFQHSDIWIVWVLDYAPFATVL